MPKKAVSLTLDEGNLLWLKGRARVWVGGNLSEAVNHLITEARAARSGAPAAGRSVVGTIDLPADDPALDRADAAIRDMFTASLSRVFMVRESSPGHGPRSRKRRG